MTNPMRTAFYRVLVTVALGLSVGGAMPVFAATDTGAAKPATASVVLAGGCFWCTEADFEKVPGVLSAESGYIGGTVPNPSYEAVSAGTTGHTEAVRVVYEPAKVSYRQLVDHFWRTIDPTVKDRQFCDAGSQYRSAIFWVTDAERKEAEASLESLRGTRRFKEIHTQIAKAGTFYLAEDYHQDYYKKNPIRYTYYRRSCGRDARLAELWGSK